MRRVIAAFACTALLGMALVASAPSVQQVEPTEAGERFTLIAVRCPPIIPRAGAEATVEFKAARPPRDYKPALLVSVPRKSVGAVEMTAIYYRGEKPMRSGQEGGQYTMSSDDQGFLTLELAPSMVDFRTLVSWREGHLLNGKRTLSMSLVHCYDERCSTRDSISNVLKCEVEFQAKDPQVREPVAIQVFDSSGVAIPGVSLTITSPETGSTTAARTLDGGLYKGSLVSGEYLITYEKSGFEEGQRPVTVEPGPPLQTFNITLMRPSRLLPSMLAVAVLFLGLLFVRMFLAKKLAYPIPDLMTNGVIACGCVLVILTHFAVRDREGTDWIVRIGFGRGVETTLSGALGFLAGLVGVRALIECIRLLTRLRR